MTALRRTGWSGSRVGSTPGHLLNLIRARDDWTRGGLLAETGLSRTTLFDRLNQLFTAGLAYEAGSIPSTGGRPAVRVRFEDRHRVVLIFDLGHHHGRVAVTDLDGATLRETTLPINISSTPQPLLDKVFRIADGLLDAGDSEKLVGVGMSIPGPISSVTGRLTPTTIMPGWHEYPLIERIEEHWSVPALLENDARALALGEAAARPGMTPLLAIKYSHGIGAGIVLDGQLLSGAAGAAGDIGHIRIRNGRSRVCRCGRSGCLAAYASGYALLRGLGRPEVASTVDELVGRIGHDGQVETAVKQAARLLGDTLAGLVATLNPQVIVLGGALGSNDTVVEQVSRQITTRAIDRVTSPLEVVGSTAAHPAAAGLAALVTGHVFAPETVNAQLAAGSGPRTD